MTATAHSLIGASIASVLPNNPILSFILSFAFHFPMDKIPHWDAMTDKKFKSQKLILFEAALDLVTSFTLVWLLFIYWRNFANPTNIFLSAFAGQLPDILELPYTFFKLKLPICYQNYRFQHWIHDVGYNARLSAPWGIITQAIVVGIILYIALR